jgi:hypothetical protein
VQIAGDAGAQVINYPKVSCVEELHAAECHKVPNDWILFIDPDEVISSKLGEDIVQWFNQNGSNPDLASCDVPIQFFFGNRKLNGTPWGNVRYRKLLAHKRRFEFTPDIHNGRIIKPGFNGGYITSRGDNLLNHYWAKSWNDLFNKHKRYLLKEGEARFNLGQRIFIMKILAVPFSSFYFAFIQTRGIKDGILGLRLSLFWSWYQTRASLALFRYQQQPKA